MEDNDPYDFEGDPEPHDTLNDEHPLALDVIAGLQPPHVTDAFAWTTQSAEERHAIAAKVAMEHRFTRNEAESGKELAARIALLPTRRE